VSHTAAPDSGRVGVSDAARELIEQFKAWPRSTEDFSFVRHSRVRNDIRYDTGIAGEGVLHGHQGERR